MTMEKAVHGVFAPMGPRPDAEERIWRSIDRELDGKARDCQICLRKREIPVGALLLAAAAVIVAALLLVGSAVLRNRQAAENAPPATAVAEPEPERETTPLPTAGIVFSSPTHEPTSTPPSAPTPPIQASVWEP